MATTGPKAADLAVAERMEGSEPDVWVEDASLEAAFMQKWSWYRMATEPDTIIRDDGVILRDNWILRKFDKEAMGYDWFKRMLQRDAKANAPFQKRIRAITSLPRRVMPANTTPEAAARAERTQQTIESMRDWSGSFRSILEETILKGFGGWEPVVAPGYGGTRYRIARLEYINQNRLLFNVQGDVLLRDGYNATVVRKNLTQDYPNKVFLVPRFRATSDQPYGYGLGEDMAHLCWLSIDGGWKQWAVLCERLAIPIRDVSHPPVGQKDFNAPDRNKLRSDVRALNRDATFVHDERTKLTLLQANAAGMADTFAKWLDYLDTAKFLLCTGETLTSVTAIRGSSEVATEQGKVRAETTDDDTAFFGEFLTESLVAFIEYINEGVDDPADVSRFVIGEIEDKLSPDEMRAKSDLLTAASNAGVKVPVRAWTDLGVPAPIAGEEVLEPSPAPSPLIGPPQLPDRAGNGRQPSRFMGAKPSTIERDREVLIDETVRTTRAGFGGILRSVADAMEGKAHGMR